MPQAYGELNRITGNLEKHYRDIQDFEFTIQESKLYMLQTRNGKRTGPAAVRAAVEMVEEGLISKREAVLRVDPKQLDQLLHPVLESRSRAELHLLARGLPASPGAAVGKIVFTADDAVEKASGGPVVLVRAETTPDDIHGMEVAKVRSSDDRVSKGWTPSKRALPRSSRATPRRMRSRPNRQVLAASSG